MHENNAFSSWAAVDLLGHQRIAGYVTTEQLGDATFLRVDVPETPVNPLSYTVYFNPKSIYSIAPVTEFVARGLAGRTGYLPVSPYDLPPQIEERVIDRTQPLPWLLREKAPMGYDESLTHAAARELAQWLLCRGVEREVARDAVYMLSAGIAPEVVNRIMDEAAGDIEDTPLPDTKLRPPEPDDDWDEEDRDDDDTGEDYPPPLPPVAPAPRAVADDPFIPF